MNRFIFSPLVFLFCVINVSLAQDQMYHRAVVDLQGKNPLLLLRAGIPVDHGKMAPGRSFESDFSEEEIQKIEKLGFNVDIKIRDVETYYADPNRPSELVQYTQALRDFDCKSKVSKIATPFNYFDGSMGGYFRYDEMLFIMEWMKDLYPELVSKMDTIRGYKTHDGNVITYLKISDFPAIDENEPELLYTALHHAREPNSLSQMIFYMWYLLENYYKNPEIKYLVDHTEMYFVPCVNPDGYKINIKNKPDGGGLWRKNGRKDESGKLVGVDLNRNYGYEWGYDDEGSSPNQGSETYRGTAGFSEPETSAIREFCVSRNFVMALNFHTFGNLLIHPWGYNDQPTAENHIFTGMGNVMIKDNFFKMGTGSETVGYTTNGDSDDYMYGEQGEKNKIYSFTPEVGPSFWPSPGDIDILNKSCLEMNLALPRLALGLVSHDVADVSDLHMADDTFYLHFNRPGFGNKPVNIQVGLDAGMGDNSLSFLFSKAQGEDTLIAFPYLIDAATLNPGKNDAYIYVRKDYGDFSSLDSIKVEVYYGDLKFHFADAANNTAKWQILDGNWGVTPASFTSAPTSITDSPSSSYARGTTTTLRMANPVDLTEANSPLLTFNARWSIEKGYDYGAVYAYTLTGDTVYLCGKYTHPGTEDQKTGYPVYDGVQENWIKEVIDLSAFEGESELYIDFEIVSDGFLEMDGWYIDDVDVISFKPVSTATQQVKENNSRAYPNPTADVVNIAAEAGTLINIFDARGIKAAQTKVSTQGTVSFNGFANGLYHLVWTNAAGVHQSASVTLLR